jgi:hypothetical protein
MIAHVNGLPVEETLASFAPALLLGTGVAWARLRARLHRLKLPATPVGIRRRWMRSSATTPREGTGRWL